MPAFFVHTHPLMVKVSKREGMASNTSEIVHAVIDLNNRCVEGTIHLSPTSSFDDDDNYHDNGIGGGRPQFDQIFALQSAIALIKRGIVESTMTLQQPSRSPLSSEHQAELSESQPSTATVSVVIKFQPPAEESLLIYSPAPLPIVMCCNLILLEAVTTPLHNDDNEDDGMLLCSGTFCTEVLQLISMALLFNMGLIYHQIAFNTQPFHSFGTNVDYPLQMMIRSSAIYELLIELCDMSIVDIVDTSLDPMIMMMRMIQMMAYNNYGRICYEFGKYSLYQTCMESIQHTLQQYRPVRRMIDMEDYHSYTMIHNEIRLNVFVYRLSPIPIVASAA